MTPVEPLDQIKSDARFFAFADRVAGNGYTVACQLSATQYVALDGKTLAGYTFKRWRKLASDAGDPMWMDRMYITWQKSPKARRVAEIGYIEAHAFSGMTPDAEGRKGVICTHINPQLSQEMATALANVLAGDGAHAA